MFVATTVALTPALMAQITYVRTGPNKTFQLRQMNANGTGDQAIAFPSTTVGFPTWSRDGAVLAVSAFEPSNIPAHTWNVYGIAAATGAVQKLTDYHDLLDPTNVSFSYTFPYYKAFSPDRRAIATFSLTQTGGSNSTNDGGGVVDVPVLEIHSLTTAANPILVHVDKTRNGRHHGGEGVDWSPTQNVLAAPLESSAPFLSGGGPGETTAIFLIDPVTTAVQQGRARQVTSPRADSDISTGVFWTEHDYQPKFSPNGAGLAYVRSFQSHNLLTSLNPNPDVQSIHILNLATGADTQVVQLPQGAYVTTVDWSPNGTQLVFDLSQQANSPVGLLQQGTGETNQIYLINVDGSGIKQLRGAGNGTPAWARVAVTPPVAAPGSLANISTRMNVGKGSNSLIGGFIITGAQSKKVLVRALGPSLAAAGVQGVLADPFLEIHQGNATIATNDNWRQGANTNQIPSGFNPTDDRESVLIATLNPGNYTAVVRGAAGQTGVGLVEIYDLTGAKTSRLANISTRGSVQRGDNAMIGGLIVTGSAKAKVLVRALGPSLGSAGVADALQDPTLELRNTNGGVVAQNDNWRDTQSAEIAATGVPPTKDSESALIQELAPGNYTAIVRGAKETSGVGLVEVYNLQ